MLGHKVFQAAVQKYPSAVGTLRKHLGDYPVGGIPEFQSGRVIEGCDVMDLLSVDALLEKLEPELVVNCVGVIKQRSASQEPMPSITINSLLPHRIATKLTQWGGRLVHISTDCVFDGQRGNYSEEDSPNASDLYGKTKALGEVVYSNSLTLRTSIIGRELRNHHSLLDWFLSRNHATVPGYVKVWWSGVTSNYLADLILALVDKDPGLSGLYHVSSGRMSKFALLQLLRDAYGWDVNVEPDESFVLDRSLLGSKLENAIGYKFPTWSTLLSQLINDPTPYPIPGAMSA
jgi:dTDP-4-dehydrorhamnose reductase